MVDDNDNQVFVHYDYQLVKKELAFMITKTLVIRCYSIKCDLCLDSVQQNIMRYTISVTNNSLYQSTFKGANKHHSAFLI